MNNYQISPSQLQIWSETEYQFEKWQRINFKLPLNCSPEQACEQLSGLSEVLELLCTRLVKIESLSVPVQQVSDAPDIDTLQISTAIISNATDLQETITKHQTDINSGNAIVTLAIYPKEAHFYAILMTNRSHFDSISTQLLANLILNPPSEYEATQFLDFSEWINEGFAESSQAQLGFWHDRQTLSNPELGTISSQTTKVGKSSLTIPFQAEDNWEDNVLAAWLKALNTRLDFPELLRFDRVLSYRSLGELDDVIGPLQIRVPMQIDLNQNELSKKLGIERQQAEEYLTSFDLKAARESSAAIVFEVVESNVDAMPISGALNLQVSLDNGQLQLSFYYLNNVIDSKFAEIILEAIHFTLQNQQQPGPKELAWQQHFGNGGAHPESKDPIEMLQALAEDEPNAAAVTLRDITWTRAQLWERILAISTALKSHGVGAGHHVGFLLHKDHDAIASIFGILHSGAAYVPFDPEWPTLRINKLCEDASVSILVTNQECLENHKIDENDLLILDDLSIAQNNATKKDFNHNDQGLGYILYTSGSTGQPKGACIPRIAMSHLAHAFATSLYKDQAINHSFTVNAPLFFDGSVKQIVMLLLGGSLYLIDEKLRRQPAGLVKALHDDNVQCLDCTPTHLRLLIEASAREEIPLPPTVLIGGETIDDHLWERLSNITTTNFINVYGPTEATVVSTWSPIQMELAAGIGTPLPGCKIWVKDEDGNACTIGTIGELWIGGDRVAKGYLGRPDLTATSFVDAPDGIGKAYRSGDHVRWLNDGRLAFHGRIDHQIKLRGHRIELGEIEAVITAHPAIHNSAVIPHSSPSGETHITAFAEVHGSDITRDNILPNGKPLAERTRIETDYLFKEIFVDEVYGAHNVVLPKDGLIFDVGANIGMFSIWAKHRWPSASIHAFEPVPGVAKVCSQNLSDLKQVNFHPHGLSNVKGELEFIHYPNYSMMSGIVEGADGESERGVIRQQLENRVAQGDQKSLELLNNLDQLLDGRFESEKIHIPVQTLTKEFERLNVDEVHLLKIDVQRSELNVLQGIDAAAMEKVKQIVMEVHDAHGTPSQGRVDTIMNLLEDYGFEVRVQQDDDLKGTDRFSLVAWRPEWRDEITDSYEKLATCDVDDIHDRIHTHLPDYMRPNHIQILQKFPFTDSGKIDRKALAGMVKIGQSDDTGDMPANDLEHRLASIWSKILGVEKVGVTESFFRLGGDSISGIRLQVESSEAGLHFELRHLFEYQTIRKLATCTELTSTTQLEALEPFALLNNATAQEKLPSGLDDAYPMSGLQQGMLFHIEYTDDPRTYHNITTKRLRADFSPEAFTLAWQHCINAHEILRTGFSFGSGEALQLVHTNVVAVPEYLDWSELNASTIDQKTDELLANELSIPFDLEKPPLVRLRLCKLPNNEVLFAIAEHHAILDGLSLEFLRDELLSRYQIALTNGEQLRHNLDCRPAHFIEREQVALTSTIEPWRTVLENAKPIRISYGQSLPEGNDRSFEQHIQKVSPELKIALEKRAQNLGVQLKHLLLAVHARVLGQSKGIGDVLTGMVIHGRPERRDSELMLGLFINTLPVRLQIDRGSWSELILSAKQEDQRLQEYRHTPLWMLRREFGSSADLPTFFNYVAFDTSEPVFEVLEERHVGVDVDVDLAVDFSIEDGNLIILHQYPKATAADVQSLDLLNLTLKTLEEASDENDRVLEPVSNQKQAEIELPKSDTEHQEKLASTESIQLVTSVVADVLSIAQPSEKDSFRELGGHSLQAVEVIHRLRQSIDYSSSLMRTLADGLLEDVAAQLTLDNNKNK